MTRLRFGVVGCGAVATELQLPALRRAPGAELVAVTDVDAGWARAVAGRVGAAEWYTDHRELIGRVDAALVATPNATHAEIAVALLEAGVHVLCEKPLATTRADADRMLGAAARSGARLMAAHCLRFSPNIALLHRMVTDGWFGPLEVIEAGIGGSYERSARRTDFRRQRRLAGGGVLVDLGVHVIDLAVWLAGGRPTDVVYDAGAAPGWEVETDAEVALRFPGRSEARLAASFTHGLENQLVVRGVDGWASASLYAPTELVVFREAARVCRQAGLQRVLLPDASMYDAQIAHFCDAVRTGADFVVRSHEVESVIDVIERCYAS